MNNVTDLQHEQTSVSLRTERDLAMITEWVWSISPQIDRVIHCSHKLLWPASERGESVCVTVSAAIAERASSD